ncbi:MAG: hypothetical protein ACKV2U_21120 [Bryobacteraceae bacterium]
MTPEELDALAKDLHHEWDSPLLWPRIAHAAPPRRRWWPVILVAAAALVVTLYLAPHSKRQAAPIAANSPLLTEQALVEVEAAETAYRKSIERLARVAAPKLDQPATPLLLAYAEKLALLDGAISGLRRELDANGFNTHLRLQMAALYRDKQKTLEQVLHHD